MITYEYQCQECDHVFEVVQSMGADPLTRCPKCKGKVERLISGGLGSFVKTNTPPCAAAGGPTPPCASKQCGGDSPCCQFAE